MIYDLGWEDEGFDELLAVEALEVRHLFSQAYIPNGNLKLVRYSDDHTAFGCAVQFGDGQ